jgi:hypothetical protein
MSIKGMGLDKEWNCKTIKPVKLAL